MPRRLAPLWAAALAAVLAGCTSTSAVKPMPTPVSNTPAASDSPTATPAPSAAASPTPTPSSLDPLFVPALSAIQMVGPRLGWAVGSHAIFATSDGAHWTKQFASTEEFVGVDFISTTTGGVVGARSLLGTSDGGRAWHHIAQGQSWSKALQRPDQPAAELGPATLIQCGGPRSLWVLFLGGGAAMSHSPYIAYATTDGSSWRAVLNEPMTMHQSGVPAGPDSYPPSFSVVDPSDAVFVGDGPATNVAQCVIASNGGASLRRTGAIQNATETFAAAFVSVTTGWVLTRNGGGDYVINATTDGGYHWSQQLAVPPTSAG